MVLKEDGTKWACQSCLKGHRVSGCNHTDRPLQFVLKKGRPVTQCQHCRVERKKRSAHVKCDCGEKQHSKEKCIHLRNAEATQGELIAVPESEETANKTCCCSHGEQCVCFAAKSGDEQGLESHPSHARTKPRLTTTQSEGHLTVFANGHHKPTHRNTAATHEANMPYRVHKSHPAHTIHGLHAAGRRSVDSLVGADKAAKLSIDQLQQMAAASSDSETGADNQDTASQLTFDAFSIPVDTLAPSGTDDIGVAQSESTTQATDPFNASYPQSALSDASGDFNWNAFDWTTITAVDNTQPALTYASSNTISELGDHTPPDESGSGYNLRPNNALFNKSSAQTSSVVGHMMNGSAEQQGGQSQQIRWSLPPSFWADPNTTALVELMTTANYNSDPMMEKNDPQQNDVEQFCELDSEVTTRPELLETSVLPPSLSLPNPPAYVSRNGQGNIPGTNSWDLKSMAPSMQFDGQSMQAAAGGSGLIGLDYARNQDQSDETYSGVQSDPFFGLDIADVMDFSSGFAAEEMDPNWSS